jgi:hypothetical protein
MADPTLRATLKAAQQAPSVDTFDLGALPLIRFSFSPPASKLGFLSAAVTSTGKTESTSPLFSASREQEVSGLFSLPIGGSGKVRAALVGAEDDVYADTIAFSTQPSVQSDASLDGMLMTYEVGHWERKAQRVIKLVGRVS